MLTFYEVATLLFPQMVKQLLNITLLNVPQLELIPIKFEFITMAL